MWHRHIVTWEHSRNIRRNDKNTCSNVYFLVKKEKPSSSAVFGVGVWDLFGSFGWKSSQINEEQGWSAWKWRGKVTELNLWVKDFPEWSKWEISHAKWLSMNNSPWHWTKIAMENHYFSRGKERQIYFDDGFCMDALAYTRALMCLPFL